MADSVQTLSVPGALTQRQKRSRPLVQLLRFCRRKPLGAIGALIVVGLIVMAVFANRIAPYTYEETIRGARMKPPSAQFWMGTDNLGRDIWSRVVYGARISVTVGFATVALATVLATLIGVSSAYLGGAYDIVVQRVVDAWMSFPALVIILSMLAALGPGLLNLILALAVLGAAGTSRVIRGAALSTMQNPYVEAARGLGAGHTRLVFRHVLPNVMGEVVVLGSLWTASAIRVEANLSFIGLGVSPPTPTWGNMIRDGTPHLLNAPWLSIFPGLAILVTVLAFNLLGDGLRDLLDPIQGE